MQFWAYKLSWCTTIDKFFVALQDISGKASPANKNYPVRTGTGATQTPKTQKCGATTQRYDRRVGMTRQKTSHHHRPVFRSVIRIIFA